MGRATSMRPAACLVLTAALGACAGTTATGSTTPASQPPASTCAPPAAMCGAGSTAPPAAPSPQRDPGTTRIDSHGITQAWVPGGSFTMGSDEGSASPPSWARIGFRSEQPAHEVALSRGYWIDVTEVTVAAFSAFKAGDAYEDQAFWSAEGWKWRQARGGIELPKRCLPEQTPEQPQVCVTWFEAEAYATWRGGRLPTEAEWEFAARGPESRIYPWGNTFDGTLANLDGATGPVAVGGYPGGASWIGGLDMAGNAMEWVADWWSSSYEDAARDDPTGPATGSIKVEKGGWWGPPDDAGVFISRSSYRHFEDPPLYSDHHIGFRIVTPE